MAMTPVSTAAGEAIPAPRRGISAKAGSRLPWISQRRHQTASGLRLANQDSYELQEQSPHRWRPRIRREDRRRDCPRNRPAVSRFCFVYGVNRDDRTYLVDINDSRGSLAFPSCKILPKSRRCAEPYLALYEDRAGVTAAAFTAIVALTTTLSPGFPPGCNHLLPAGGSSEQLENLPQYRQLHQRGRVLALCP